MENLYAFTPSDSRISTSSCSQVQNASHGDMVSLLAGWLVGSVICVICSRYHVAMVVVVRHVGVPPVLDPSNCQMMKSSNKF
jgi:hypothetical protein